MNRIRKILLKECDGMGLDSEALWALLGVLSLVIILEVFL